MVTTLVNEKHNHLVSFNSVLANTDENFYSSGSVWWENSDSLFTGGWESTVTNRKLRKFCDLQEVKKGPRLTGSWESTKTYRKLRKHQDLPEVEKAPGLGVLQDVLAEAEHGQEAEEEHEAPDDKHNEARRPWGAVLGVEERVLDEQEPLDGHGADNEGRGQPEADHDKSVKSAQVLPPGHLNKIKWTHRETTQKPSSRNERKNLSFG